MSCPGAGAIVRRLPWLRFMQSTERQKWTVSLSFCFPFFCYSLLSVILIIIQQTVEYSSSSSCAVGTLTSTRACCVVLLLCSINICSMMLRKNQPCTLPVADIGSHIVSLDVAHRTVLCAFLCSVVRENMVGVVCSHVSLPRMCTGSELFMVLLYCIAVYGLHEKSYSWLSIVP